MSGQVTFTLSYNDPDGLFDPIRPLLDENILAGAHRWSDIIDGTATIDIVINHTDNPRASARSLTSSFTGETNGEFNVFHQGAAAKVIQGVDRNGSTPDLEINLNAARFQSGGSTWLDPSPLTRDTPVPSNKRDAMTVFIHEIGHAMAYSGWMDSSTGEYPGDFQSTFDRHRTWDGTNQFFEGPTAVLVNSGAIPLTFGGGAHPGNDPPRPGGNLLGDIMNGEELLNGRRYDLSPLNVATLLDVGFETTVGRTPDTVIDGVEFSVGWRGEAWDSQANSWQSVSEAQTARFGDTTEFDFLGNPLAITAEATVLDAASESWTISIQAVDGGPLFDPSESTRWQGWRIDRVAVGEFDSAPNSGAGDPIDVLNFINFDTPAAIGEWTPQSLELLSGDAVVQSSLIDAKAESNGIYLNGDFGVGGLIAVSPPGQGSSDLGLTEVRLTIAVSTYFSQLPGDYNQDGQVDAADYEAWRSAFGSADFAADGNGDGLVDAADYTVWRDSFETFGGVFAAVTPEPSAAMLLLIVLAVRPPPPRRRRRCAPLKPPMISYAGSVGVVGPTRLSASDAPSPPC